MTLKNCPICYVLDVSQVKDKWIVEMKENEALAPSEEQIRLENDETELSNEDLVEDESHTEQVTQENVEILDEQTEYDGEKVTTITQETTLGVTEKETTLQQQESEICSTTSPDAATEQKNQETSSEIEHSEATSTSEIPRDEQLNSTNNSTKEPTSQTVQQIESNAEETTESVDETAQTLTEEETQPLIQHIDLSNYPKIRYYNSMNANEAKIMDTMLVCANNALQGNESRIEITIDGLTEDRNMNLITSYLSAYQLRFPYSPIGYQMLYENNNKIQMIIDMDVYRERYAKREYVEQEIEAAISSFTEGDEKHKLKQIADWISNRFNYKSMQLEVYTALTTGVGNCNAYGLLFKMMAERLNIPCDICVGNSDIGRHLWNRVTLSDGSILFYDVCYYHCYDKNTSWIERTTSPWPNYILNDYYVYK